MSSWIYRLTIFLFGIGLWFDSPEQTFGQVIQTPPPNFSGTVPNPSVVEPTPLTIDSIQSRLQQIQADTTLSPDTRQTLVQTFEAIQAEIRLRNDEEKRVKELVANADQAPTSTDDARRRKEEPPSRDSITASALQDYSMTALQALLLSQQTNYQAAVDGRMKSEMAIASRDARRKELPKLISEQRSAIQKTTDEASIPAPEATDVTLREALTLLGRAKVTAANERLKKFEQELRTYDAENELIPLRRDNYASDERYFQQQVKEVNDELNRRRQNSIEIEKAKAESLAAAAPPELKPLASSLVLRAQAWLELAKKNTAVQVEIEQAKKKQKFWEERFQIRKSRSLAKSRSGRSIMNDWNGLLLRRHRNELPDESKLQNQLHQNESRMQQTETLIMELEDWRNQTAANQIELPLQSERNVKVTPESDSESHVPASLTPGLIEQAALLQNAERELVSKFIVDADSYSNNLFELSELHQSTIDLVKEYRKFIDQHILWTRSTNPFNRTDSRQIWPAVQWMLDFKQWGDAGQILIAEFRARPWEVVCVLSAFIFLMINLSRMRRTIAAIGEKAGRSTNIQFFPTLQAICLTFAMSFPFVMILGFAGYRLTTGAAPQTFPYALGMGFLVASRYFFPLEVLRQVARRGGLAEKHFEWEQAVTGLLRNNLRWLIDLGVPAIGIVALFYNAGQDRFENALGRIAFSAVLVLSSLFLFIVLRPRQGVFTSYLEEHALGWADRLRYFWFVALVGGPLVLMALSLMGYHYTAVRLSMHWHTTAITLVGILLLAQIMRRWLLLSRRKIMADQARLRLEQARQQAASSTGGSTMFTSSAGSTGPEMSVGDRDVLTKSVDLADINAQTLRLVSSSLSVAALLAVCYIWSGVLPAVNVLDSITLWNVQGAKPDELIPITLSNILLAVPVFVLMFVAARNLPGLLEIALLQYLPIENAVRYAISSLSRYIIVTVGIMVAFYYLGVRWASVQWLVAALGVGLGFGLQEIFANFVSGLILLFEQPIRVGDVITIGDTTGSVSRIRVRATTITNFDRQELIIPNKDLITGRLLNWTLSDTTNRIVVNIGLALGSETDKACRLITEICSSHPNILSDPPPTAHFEGITDSMLIIKVRFFLETLDNRLPTTHDIYTAIHARFLATGIVLAHQQRDLHLLSFPESLSNYFGRPSGPPKQTR